MLRSLAKLLLVWICCLLPAPILEAGVLVSKTRQVEAGPLTEGGDSLTLQGQYGSTQFKKSSLIWYSVDSSVNSLLAGGKKALSEGNEEAALILFEASLNREPVTKGEAYSLIQRVKATANARVAEQIAKTRTAIEQAPPLPGETETISPEEKIRRGEALLESGRQMKSQTHISPATTEHFKAIGEKKITEGKMMVEEGRKQLEIMKAQQAAALAEMEAQQEEIRKAVEIDPQDREKYFAALKLTSSEKQVNFITALAFFGLAFLAFWQITMREPERKK
jgi:tetratricopeptide (TPR) repeat protein